MNINDIVIVTWDPDDYDSSSRALHIGRYQGVKDSQYSEATHLQLYGFGIDIANSNKDYQLHHYGLHSSNLCSQVEKISKEEARTLLITELDKALDLLFSDESENESTSIIKKESQKEQTPSEEE